MKLTKNFSLSEFQCRDGSKMPEEIMFNIKRLAENLQVIRDKIGQPVHITSGYRSPEYNKKVGGVENSQHLKGNAADITTKNLMPAELGFLIKNLIEDKKIKQGGVGVYPGFVHYDIRGIKARW